MDRRRSRLAAYAAKAMQWRVDQLLKCLIHHYLVMVYFMSRSALDRIKNGITFVVIIIAHMVLILVNISDLGHFIFRLKMKFTFNFRIHDLPSQKTIPVNTRRHFDVDTTLIHTSTTVSQH